MRPTSTEPAQKWNRCIDLLRFSLPIVIWKSSDFHTNEPALAIPPEPPVAITPLLHGGAELARARPAGRGASEPLPVSTAVRSTSSDGRFGGVAAIPLVSSEQTFANSSGVR